MGKNVIISTLPNISQNYLPKVNTSNIFANSLVYDDGSSVLINTTTASAFRLDVSGTGRFQGALTGTSATFTLANDITLTARSGAAGSYTYWSLGRTSSELELGVAAAANQFFTGTAAGDVIIKANGSSNKLMFGYGSGSPTLTLASTGAATFSSSVTATSFSVSNGTLSNSGFWGTLITAGAGTYSDWALINSGTTRIMHNPTGTLNIIFNGNVGIGTTSPSGGISGTETALHIYNTNAAVLALQSADPTNGRKYQIYTGNTGALIFRDDTGASTRMVITNGGNVGIGTTSPDRALTVNGQIGVSSDFVSTKGGQVFRIGYEAYTSTGGVNLFTEGAIPLVLGTSSSEKMRITSGGNVGIGTTSPSTALHVVSNDGSANRTNPFNVATITATSGSAPYNGFGTGLVFAATHYNSIVYNGARIRSVLNDNSVSSLGNSIAFDVTPTRGGTLTEAVRIDYNGNVGIGTTLPTFKLDIQNNTQAIARILDTSTNASLVMQAGTGAGMKITGYNYNTSTAVPLYISVDGANTIMQSGGGNVGIGTTSPGNFNGLTFSGPFLDIAGVLQVKGTSANTVAIIQLGGDTYRKANILSSIGTEDPYLAFATASSGTSSNATERMRITSGGEVWVNRTSVNVNNAKLASYQGYNVDTNSTALAFQRTAGYFDISAGDNSNNQGSYSSIVARTITGQATNKGVLLRGYSNTWNGSAYEDILMVQINWNGNITNANGSYGTISSDRRLKENIIPATSKLNDLSKLNVVNFNLIGNEEKHIGFIAQEMKEVFPSLVYQVDTRKYDDEGNVIGGYEDTLGLKVGMEFAILVKAIQELKAENDQQKADIESLKALINK